MEEKKVKEIMQQATEDTQEKLSEQDIINKQKLRTEYERIDVFYKKIEEKAKEDIGYLIHPDRYEGESREEFLIRRRISNQYIKHRLQPTTFFRSKIIEVKDDPEDKDKPENEKRKVFHTTTKTFSNPDRKNIKLRKEKKKER